MSADKATATYLERARNEKRDEIFDTGFYVCVCFETRAQLQEWLALNEFDPENTAINGLDLADNLKQELKSPRGVNLDTNHRANVSKAWLDRLSEK